MTVNRFPDMMVGEDKCLPPWVLPKQDAGLLPCPLITLVLNLLLHSQTPAHCFIAPALNVTFSLERSRKSRLPQVCLSAQCQEPSSSEAGE